MLQVTVTAVAAPFYGKKGSALQPHLKDPFQKISPRRPNIPCTKPGQQIFTCSLRRSIRHAAAKPRGAGGRSRCTSSNVLRSRACAPPACAVREAPLDSCGPVEVLTAEGSGPCHVHLCDHGVFMHSLAYSSRIVFHGIGAFGFVQRLVLAVESRSNTWGIPQKSDFQVLLETRLHCVLSKISHYLSIHSSRLWYK